jgi:hypothetical protein
MQILSLDDHTLESLLTRILSLDDHTLTSPYLQAPPCEVPEALLRSYLRNTIRELKLALHEQAMFDMGLAALEKEMCIEVYVSIKMGQRWYSELQQIIAAYKTGGVFWSYSALNLYLACCHSMKMMEGKGWKTTEE